MRANNSLRREFSLALPEFSRYFADEISSYRHWLKCHTVSGYSGYTVQGGPELQKTGICAFSASAGAGSFQYGLYFGAYDYALYEADAQLQTSAGFI